MKIISPPLMLSMVMIPPSTLMNFMKNSSTKNCLSAIQQVTHSYRHLLILPMSAPFQVQVPTALLGSRDRHPHFLKVSLEDSLLTLQATVPLHVHSLVAANGAILKDMWFHAAFSSDSNFHKPNHRLVLASHCVLYHQLPSACCNLPCAQYFMVTRQWRFPSCYHRPT